MQKQLKTTFRSQFEEDVYKGLTDFPKNLSSKYFYDVRGDKIFQDIMDMPEYYLTNSELDILNNHKEVISNWFSKGGEQFDLIELGAGDGKKTKVLLEHLSRQNVAFNYIPIDISQNALDKLETSINLELPEVNIKPLQGTYFEVLDRINSLEHHKKVILFLGSNIGNLLHEQAISYLTNIQVLMAENDLLFVGFDQKKHPQTVLNAYNDVSGITEAFNKNMLARMNSELRADFDLDKFLHWEVYDPESGTAKSYLVANTAHDVLIESLNLEISFKKWETIHMEISQKYDDEVVAWLAKQSGLRIEAEFSDFKNYYKNYIFSKEI